VYYPYLWPILQILDGAPAVSQDPDTVLIRVESMNESTTDSRRGVRRGWCGPLPTVLRCIGPRDSKPK
ncbi:hypothetical protein TNCV_2752421, partial [Trichonephila clavipes]